MNRQNVWLCDIDGTLADNSHRNAYDESKVAGDSPLPTCDIIKALLARGDKVIYLSGRTEKCFKDTIEWLIHNVGPVSGLFMRGADDKRKDSIVKKEIYDTYIKDRYKVSGVFDDRLQVCRMWYDLGLYVFNVNQGLKEF